MQSLRCPATPAVRPVCQRPAARKAAVCMAKPDIHPEFYEEAKVFCNGEEVMSLGGTKPEYVVDLWSGNHPFFQGATNTVVVDEGRVNRFNRRFAGLDSLGKVETASGMKKGKKE
ncbi:unnamed protein product [Pedinophyceae sp. YPF-701]|nr:unnamed protein product [Pedinophyceae sp. YPF-701]